jgi:hypothetical protein
MKTAIRSLIMIVALTCIAADAPKAHAVVPPPDGGYPNFTTAEGTNALKNLTTGAANTAVGWFSLFGDTTASFNTGVGAGTLLFNNGDQNTAVGVAALLSNTTGSFNTATGVSALSGNTTGVSNNAFGWGALLSNTTGNNNTAIGLRALQSNTEGVQNVAVGEAALSSNTTGSGNTAIGYNALFNNTDFNGSSNTALGQNAGYNLTTGFGNVCIGAGVNGVAGESNTTRIRNIYSSVAAERAVYVDSDNKIGTMASSRRYKDEIKPMEKASEVLFALKPVSFRYKKEFDAGRLPMFGLIAEDVEQVDPDLVSRNKKGEVETVRYEQINAMLLNEFLKEHRRVQEQEATIALLQSADAKQEATISDLQKDVEVLTAQLKEQATQIQKVSAQVELGKSKPRTVVSNQ